MDPYSWHNSALLCEQPDVWSVNLAVQRFTAGGVRQQARHRAPSTDINGGVGGISGPYQTLDLDTHLTQIPTTRFRRGSLPKLPSGIPHSAGSYLSTI